MRHLLVAAMLGAACWTAGCTIEPAPRPRVIHREVYYDEPAPPPEGSVIVEGDERPALRVEVVPVRPYPRAEWISGHWDRYGRHRYVWVRGHWR
jgi:hypothetical protein